MSKTEEDIARLSNEAAAVWNNPLVQDFIKNYPQKIFAQWADAKNTEVREQLWFEFRGAEAFTRAFLTHLAGGKALKKKRDGKIAEGIGAII